MKSPTGLVLIAALSLSAVAVGALGYRYGRRTILKAPPEGWFSIDGVSMEPTLAEGARCHARAFQRAVQIGDVIAIRWNGKDRIKRVAALAGDRVDRVRGRLVINGQRLEDLIASRKLTVAQTRGPETALERQPEEAVIWPGLVPVPAPPSDWIRPNEESDWLIFHYRNPFQSGRLTAVPDDYPNNQTLKRQLHSVDRLVLRVQDSPNGGQPSMKFSEAIGDSKRVPGLLAAFFDPVGKRTVPVPVRDGTAALGEALISISRDGVRVDQDQGQLPELDESHPIALRVGRRPVSFYGPSVWREVEYRDDRPSGVFDYPLLLGAGEVFVVGDNVPVSVDSRQMGPLPLSAVLGTVDLIDEGRSSVRPE